MGEFELIRQIFMPLAGKTGSAALLLGPGDDCAIQRPEPGTDLVFSIDTLVEGVHFPKDYDPQNLGWRALAVAVSDLAAMGASPDCFTLALTLPSADRDWLERFALGLGDAAQQFEIALAGGDTTKGPLALSIQVHGSVPAGEALRRSGAGNGDLICVSGTLGDAGAALAYLDESSPSRHESSLLERYHRPSPRIVLGRRLCGFASAAVDVSDGLLSDLDHILEASGLGAELDARTIPLSEALRQTEGERALQLALTAGDDYELCVTIPPDQWARLPAEVQSQLTVIGTTVSGRSLRLLHADHIDTSAWRGYDHFGDAR